VIPGDTLSARFLLQDEAGSGGMGTVFRAVDRASGDLVAVKILRSHAARDQERFLREAALLGELRHPGIVRYVDHGRTSLGAPFLAMEWLEGETLGERLAAGPLGIAMTVAMGTRIADALGLAHERGVIHRDVKPGNLFLPDGDLEQVKIVDFGVARGVTGPSLTQTGALVGTPGYMAPEQARGGREVDARADVFALGCVLWECLTGEPAFVAEEMMGLLAKILLEEVPRLRETLPGAPERLESLLARMLAKEPQHRPAHAAEVAVELAEIAEGALGSPAEQAARVPIARVLTRNEQRVLSVLVVRPAAQPILDPAAAATLAAADAPPDDEALRAIVEPMGGRLERLVDGSLVVRVIGAQAASDQAALAARAALALAARLPGAALAVATGRGVLALRTPVGEVIDRAVRLVPRGEARIVLDDETAGLLGSRFEVGAGMTLLGEREGETVRTVLGRVTACVGRDREVRALRASFEQAVSEPVAQAVLITAPPGQGKSRLRCELVSWIRSEHPGCEILFGRGEPVSAGAPFGLLAPAIRRLSGIADADPIELRRRKLRARISRHLEPRDAHVSELLGEVAGIPFPDDRSEILRAVRRDPKRMADALRDAWEAWLLAELGAAPLLIVLEDLHLGDLPSVRLLEGALRRLEDQPLMVLALARPDVHQQFPRLFGERRLDELRLAPLSRRAAERLVAEILPSIDAGTTQRLVDLADGNPFYLEELCRHAQAGPALPATILGTVQARLDTLGEEAKRVLRAASVFGERFWRGGVAALLGERTQGLSQLLEELAGREVIVRRTRDAVAGEKEFAFGHSLLREAAYAMLTDADRVLGHRLAGAWLESVHGAEAASPLALAQHYDRGREPASAARWFRRAAEQALEGSDVAAAIERAERGLACGAQGELAGWLRLCLAESHLWQGNHTKALEAAQAAAEALPVESSAWFRAATLVIEAACLTGEAPRARSWARRVSSHDGNDTGARVECLARAAKVLLFSGRVRLAEELLDELDRAVPRVKNLDHTTRGHVSELAALWALYRGDLVGHLHELEAAHLAFQLGGDARAAGQARALIGFGLIELGAIERGEQVLRESLAWAEAVGFTPMLGTAWKNLARIALVRGRPAEAKALAGRAVEVFRAARVPRMEGASLRLLAESGLMAGDLDEALANALRAVDVLAFAPPKRVGAFGTLARVHLARGEVQSALAAARAAAQLIATIGVADEGREAAEIALVDALTAAGEVEEAQARVTAAAEAIRRQAGRIGDPVLREAYLAAPERAAVVERARTPGDRL
jgi:eukaryotic-like serine/threonine-protein kinase